MERLITYGLFNGKLKHISEVENGIGCNCICANCKSLLIAKNNKSNVKAAHFAHQSGKECEGAFESTLHLLAKKVFSEIKQLQFPHYHYDYNSNNSHSVFGNSKQRLTFDEVILEQSVIVGDYRIIPDAIGIINNKKIFIEFANTHFVDDGKKLKIMELNVACLEIDLFEQNLDELRLSKFLRSDFSNRKWVTNPRLDKEYENHKIKLAVENEKKKTQEKILKQQRANDDENRKRKAKEKIEFYKKQENIKLLELENEKIPDCPLIKVGVANLKSSKFYNHPILKAIIDGEFWNKRIYGFMPNGRWIFLSGEQIYIYPPENLKSSLSEDDTNANHLFYAGLHEIIKNHESPSLYDCRSCNFYRDHVLLENRITIVCSFQRI